MVDSNKASEAMKSVFWKGGVRRGRFAAGSVLRVWCVLKYERAEARVRCCERGGRARVHVK